MIKVAFFSFADIDNFGDILFSHIFKMEIEKRLSQVQIDFFTPTDYNVEGLRYNAYNKKKIQNSCYNALILFGGEVIHLYDQKTWLPIYEKKQQKLQSDLPSDVVFDWSNIEGPFKAWVSVGVRPIDRKDHYHKIRQSACQLDYISTRGILSKKILEDLQLEENNSKIEVTPDLGWLFPNLLCHKGERGRHYKKFIPFEKYLVFQINNISIEEGERISNFLNDFQKSTNIKVILLPVIRPWEDFKYLKMINEANRNSFELLPNNLSILEIADILVHAHLVLCSSLHAAITALASGIPAGIVNKWQGTKLQDLFGHQYRLHMVSHDFDQIPVLLNQLLNERREGNSYLAAYSQFNRAKLDMVFDNLVNSIKNN